MCKIYLTLSFCFLGRFGIVFFLIYIYGYGFHSIIQEERVCLSSGIVVFPKKKNTTLKVQVELRRKLYPNLWFSLIKIAIPFNCYHTEAPFSSESSDMCFSFFLEDHHLSLANSMSDIH